MVTTNPVDLAINTAEDKKAQDIITLDITGLSTIADKFIIITGMNTTHTRAISDAITDALAPLEIFPYRKHGYQAGDWILLDYVDFVIHVFLPATREYYQLERLWSQE